MNSGEPDRIQSPDNHGMNLYQPMDSTGLWHWIKHYSGIQVAKNAVCPGHHAPWDFLKTMYFQRPPVSLALGGRGTGKSFLTALGTHLMSRQTAHHRVRVLGGSLAQSLQIYEAMQSIVKNMESAIGPGHHEFQSLTKNRGVYPNGSEIMILPASNTSVRGPHVPTLLLDEVDEIPSELRESAMGMCMNLGGLKASTVMTSTWHRTGGPMTELVARGEAGEFPFFRFCIFEVLERCPNWRSGPDLENCPSCPLLRWCHDVRDGGPPRAKRSDGHYSIDSVIQKLMCVSQKIFEADYLCMGPRADGLWFNEFQRGLHVHEKAEFNPSLPVHMGLDSGVYTGAVLFQVQWHKIQSQNPITPSIKTEFNVPDIHVFAEFLSEGHSAEWNARNMLNLIHKHCNGRIDYTWTDPAGGARNPIGPTVLAEYQRVGLKLTPWPYSLVVDSLAGVESLLNPAEGPPRLTIHPRCEILIQAFENYQRARVGGQWRDWPEDPQHPHEDLIDALRGGIKAVIHDHSSALFHVPRVSPKRIF